MAAKPVLVEQAPEPDELAVRIEGTPAPAALESFAEFLLQRLQKETNAARRPLLALVEGSPRRRD